VAVWSAQIRCLVVASLSWLAASPLTAQEFSVYTVTRNLTGLPPDQYGQAPVVARSKTLFHAGKVYDYVDAPQEVTVYEPAHNRFTVLMEASQLSAVVSRDEIRRYLTLATDEAQNVLADLLRSSPDADDPSAAWLQFQLVPSFKVASSSNGQLLTLESPRFRYAVQSMPAPNADALTHYLDYADVISELNAVLHPHSMLPAPRSRLNQVLREQQVLPISVRRITQFSEDQVMQAEHTWTWTLSNHDRQLLGRWEAQLQKKDLRRVAFKRLQQEVLGGNLTQR
jgi:hypothetical protein